MAVGASCLCSAISAPPQTKRSTHQKRDSWNELSRRGVGLPHSYLSRASPRAGRDVCEVQMQVKRRDTNYHSAVSKWEVMVVLVLTQDCSRAVLPALALALLLFLEAEMEGARPGGEGSGGRG